MTQGQEELPEHRLLTPQDWSMMLDWATIIGVALAGLLVIIVSLGIIFGIGVFLFRAIGGV